MFYYINCMQWPLSEGYYQIPTYEDFVEDYTNEELLESFFKDFDEIKFEYLMCKEQFKHVISGNHEEFRSSNFDFYDSFWKTVSESSSKDFKYYHRKFEKNKQKHFSKLENIYREWKRNTELRIFEKLRKERIQKIYLKLKQNAYEHILDAEKERTEKSIEEIKVTYKKNNWTYDILADLKILKLPDDILFKILSYLTIQDIFNLYNTYPNLSLVIMEYVKVYLDTLEYPITVYLLTNDDWTTLKGESRSDYLFENWTIQGNNIFKKWTHFDLINLTTLIIDFPIYHDIITNLTSKCPNLKHFELNYIAFEDRGKFQRPDHNIRLEYISNELTTLVLNPCDFNEGRGNVCPFNFNPIFITQLALYKVKLKNIDLSQLFFNNIFPSLSALEIRNTPLDLNAIINARLNLKYFCFDTEYDFSLTQLLKIVMKSPDLIVLAISSHRLKEYDCPIEMIFSCLMNYCPKFKSGYFRNEVKIEEVIVVFQNFHNYLTSNKILNGNVDDEYYIVIDDYEFPQNSTEFNLYNIISSHKYEVPLCFSMLHPRMKKYLKYNN